MTQMEPFGLQWHLTNRCNLRCKHCYQDDFGSDSECSLDQLKELADRICIGSQPHQVHVNLTGGEPLLLPHLCALIEHLHGYSNLSEIQLITNGTIYNRDLMQALGRMPKLCAVKISIESGYQETNDRIRGTGNFKKMSSHIDLFRKWIQKPIIFMMTLNRDNMYSIDNSICYAKKCRVDGIIFERFVPIGRGLEMKSATLTPEDWHHVLETFAQRTILDKDPLCLLPYHAFFLSTKPSNPEKTKGALCNLGSRSMALMPDGTVFPCRRLPHKVGNLLIEPFSLIQSRLAKYHMDNMSLRLTGSLCGYCGVENCIGCRAMAHAVYGDLYDDDPVCPLLVNPNLETTSWQMIH